MSDSLRVSGPVEVKSDSADRVAFDLMVKIANYEEGQNTASRDYWLTLFYQCKKATYSSSLESILKR